MQDLARMSLVKSANKNSVDYNDLANIVDQQETLQFLQGSFCFIMWLISVMLLHRFIPPYTLYTWVAQKNVPNFRMALCNRVGEMNQQKSVCVMSKHLRICL